MEIPQGTEVLSSRMLLPTKVYWWFTLPLGKAKSVHPNLLEKKSIELS